MLINIITCRLYVYVQLLEFCVNIPFYNKNMYIVEIIVACLNNVVRNALKSKFQIRTTLKNYNTCVLYFEKKKLVSYRIV